MSFLNPNSKSSKKDETGNCTHDEMLGTRNINITELYDVCGVCKPLKFRFEITAAVFVFEPDLEYRKTDR